MGAPATSLTCEAMIATLPGANQQRASLPGGSESFLDTNDGFIRATVLAVL